MKRFYGDGYCDDGKHLQRTIEILVHSQCCATCCEQELFSRPAPKPASQLQEGTMEMTVERSDSPHGRCSCTIFLSSDMFHALRTTFTRVVSFHSRLNVTVRTVGGHRERTDMKSNLRASSPEKTAGISGPTNIPACFGSSAERKPWNQWKMKCRMGLTKFAFPRAFSCLCHVFCSYAALPK